MAARGVLQIAIAVWVASEIVLAVFRRRSSRSAVVTDRASAGLLWIVIGVSVFAGAGLHFLEAGRIELAPAVLRALALTVLVVGLTLRWAAILSLGRFFTTNVAIHDEHQVVRRGPYRWVRHPSYTGLLLAFVGLGLSFGSWLSLGVVLIPTTVAVLYRIRVEEETLLAAFGEEYASYARGTKRLIPGIY